MSFNVGSFMFNIIKIFKDLSQKLYDALNYSVDISWLGKILNFFNANVNLPNSVSLIWILGSASATILVGIIIYNIFKL